MHVVGYIVPQTWVLILNESYSSVLLILHIIVHLAYISILCDSHQYYCIQKLWCVGHGVFFLEA